MSLNSGAQIGAFTVLGLIGQGGMGKVYRARDGRLKREVALKVLPDEVASDPERVARFQREAEILATLTHQNIAGIHGIEESEGTRALVMELVDGPTLADRIAAGPIPVATRRYPSRGRSSTRWTTRTSTVCCTAISSPPTSRRRPRAR